jgi:antitoxin VapB
LTLLVVWIQGVSMAVAKLFRHGGSQAVRLPKAFRFEGTEVSIKREGADVVLTPIPAPRFSTFAEIAHHLAEKFPDAAEFPEPPPRPKSHERAIPEF